MWPIFAPLWRTLSGGRSAPAHSDTALSFRSDRTELFACLGLPPGAVRDILASGSLHPHFHYRRFHKRKPNGDQRELAEPDARLKRLQYALGARYFCTEQPHPAAIAYQKGKSTAHHVWAHAGAGRRG